MRPASLRTRRAELVAAYGTARRHHRGQTAAAERLRAATIALLKAELAAQRPRRGRPPEPRPTGPDLFEETRP